MRFKSRSETGIISSYSRAARFDRLRRRWLLPCRVRTSLPDPVYSNRRAAALWVFNFGIDRLFIQDTRVYHTPFVLQQPQAHHELGVAQPERARVRHFGIAVLAHAKRDRHLGHAETCAVGLDRTLELNPKAVLFQSNRPKNLGAGSAEPAGEIARRHSQQTAYSGIADDADGPAGPWHSAHRAARHVSRAQDEIGSI